MKDDVFEITPHENLRLKDEGSYISFTQARLEDGEEMSVAVYKQDIPDVVAFLQKCAQWVAA